MTTEPRASDNELIFVQSDSSTKQDSWNPIIGESTKAYLDGLAYDTAGQRDESLRILSRCINPSAVELKSNAVLVVGQVQSGKTASFTTLSTLARDNDFGLIIVIAGTTTPLCEQTFDRLTEDLDLDASDASERWSMVINPQQGSSDAAILDSTLKNHLTYDLHGPFPRGTAIVVVMKETTHLRNLTELLKSLDVSKAGSVSAIYARIRDLRACLPRHSLAQYTATPQALLLANLADSLSPDSICVLEPSPAYTGGDYFFGEHHDSFVRKIPDDEVITYRDEYATDVGPPPTLRKAFISYAVAFAAARLRGDKEVCSMLVHPDWKTATHAIWKTWVEAIKQDLILTLEADGDPDRDSLIVNEIEPLVTEAQKFSSDFPKADDKLLQWLLFALRNTQVQVFNSDQDRKQFKWQKSQGWVLIGGQLLGVGFTVKGLRVTHMMRSSGGGLADSVQQRARFFGYRRDYGLDGRGWFDADLAKAFADYASNERVLRSSLREFDVEGKSLKDWKRAFLIEAKWQPTRKAAQKIELGRFKTNQGWFKQRLFSKSDVELFLANRASIETYVESLDFTPDQSISGGDSPHTGHYRADTTIAELARILSELAFMSEDSGRFTTASLVLSNIDQQLPADVVYMAKALAPGRRKRSIDWIPEEKSAPHVIGRVEIHQGRNPKVRDDPSDESYKGDAAARHSNKVTLQLHFIDLKDEHGVVVGEAENLPFIALYLPEQYRKAGMAVLPS